MLMKAPRVGFSCAQEENNKKGPKKRKKQTKIIPKIVSTRIRRGSRFLEVLLFSSPVDSVLVSETQGTLVGTTDLNLYASHDVH